MKELRELSPRVQDPAEEQRPKRPRLDHNATPPVFQGDDCAIAVKFGDGNNSEIYMTSMICSYADGPKNSTAMTTSSAPNILQFGDSTLAKNVGEDTTIATNEKTISMQIVNEKGQFPLPVQGPLEEDKENYNSNGSSGGNDNLVIAATE